MTSNPTHARLLDERANYLRRAEQLDATIGDREPTAEEAAEFDRLVSDIHRTDRALAVDEVRRAAGIPGAVVPSVGPLDRDPFADPRDQARTRGEPWREIRERGFDAISDADLCARSIGAMEVAAGLSDTQRETAVRKLEAVRADGDAAVATVVLAASDPDYVSGFVRMMRGEMDLVSNEERAAMRRVADIVRAMSVGTPSAGGYLVPQVLDPSLILDDAGAVSPVRRLARTKLVASRSATFVTSSAVSASWDGEAAEVSDDSPTLGEVEVTAHKWQAFIPYSIEVELTAAGNLTGELAQLFADSRNTLEASAFVTGSGTLQPTGFVTSLVAASTPVVASTTANAFVVGDISAVYEALAVRYRDRAQWLMSAPLLNDIRAFGTSVSSSFTVELSEAAPARLLGRPVNECSTMDSTYGSGENYVAVLGDFGHYGIVDRVGMVMEHIPHLFATQNNRPSGQRGAYAFGMTGGDVLVDRAFALLNVT